MTISQPKRQIRSTVISCAIFAFFFAVAIALQITSGAYRSELGSHPDEAAHYVTGLMVHDNIAHGFHGSPLRFAQDFYNHYPKVGLGIWPPFFYLVQSAWTLCFGTSTTAVLVLIALLAAGLAQLIFNTVKTDCGAWAGALAATIFLCLPLVSQYAAMVMAESLSALLIFGATLFWGRFLDDEKPRDALGFGLCAAFAILTKGTGLALALMVPLAILFTGRFSILKKKALWFSALLIAILAGPWTWIFRSQGRGGWEEPSPSWHFTRQAAAYYSWKLTIAAGVLLGLLTIAGAISVLTRKTKRRGHWAAAASLILSVIIFQSIMPVGLEARHLLPAIPAVILFAFAGADWLARFSSRPLVLAAVGVLFFSKPFPPKSPIGFGSLGDHLSFSSFRIAKKSFSGFRPVAEKLLADNRAKITLVASDARGEGMFISETAARDPARPSRTIQRASKILAASTWSGGSYQTFFENENAVSKALLDSGVGAVVLDNSMPNPKPHQQLLRATLEHHPELFEPLETFPLTREGATQPDAIRVYIVKQPSL